ncbi:MAG: 50S ribosomal protein L32 [Candidatus Levybacteria bacterium]|nr:50S ribosomal protein L32 [Candidatus Levybacteria bacterium]
MAHEPKKRHSRARQGKRRASIKLNAPKSTSCPNCKAVMLTHTVCKKCGFYKGRQILDVQKKEKNPSADAKTA